MRCSSGDSHSLLLTPSSAVLNSSSSNARFFSSFTFSDTRSLSSSCPSRSRPNSLAQPFVLRVLLRLHLLQVLFLVQHVVVVCERVVLVALVRVIGVIVVILPLRALALSADTLIDRVRAEARAKRALSVDPLPGLPSLRKCANSLSLLRFLLL